MTSTLDHLEKTLGDSYRKEIDQEENVWRSLPFFAAILALELAAIFQVLGHLPAAGTGAWWDAMMCIAVAGLAALTALLFLSASIFPAEFRYISAEPDLLSYATGLDDDETAARAAGRPDPPDALVTFKGLLAEQYAVATNHNRQINQRRALWRSVAGLASLVSVLATLGLVTGVVIHNMFVTS